MNKQQIIDNYNKFAHEFPEIYNNEILQKLNISNINNILCQLSITEKEYLYSIIRTIQPKNIIEISPFNGGSTLIMLIASLINNISVNIKSFDVVNYSENININFRNIKRELILGDVKETYKKYISSIKKCDFLFLDSDHSYDFAVWYANEIIPLIKSGTIIFIHDWPMYSSNGACDNIIPESPNYNVNNEKRYNLEVLSVKEHLINTNILTPIINLTDLLKEQNKKYHNNYQSLAPMQILIKN